MKTLITNLLFMLIMLSTACSNGNISGVEGSDYHEPTCRDLLAQTRHSYYGTDEEIQAQICIEFDIILRKNGLSNESPAAVECRRFFTKYRNCQ